MQSLPATLDKSCMGGQLNWHSVRKTAFINNHFAGKDAKIVWKATGTFQHQQIHHTNTRTCTLTHPELGYLSDGLCDGCQSTVTSNRVESVRIQRGGVSESAHVHACVSSKAVTRCVWWKAPDVACHLMCNKKAQLGQKAKVADGRERREKGREKGIFLREIMEGEVRVWVCLKWLLEEGKLNTGSSGGKESVEKQRE